MTEARDEPDLEEVASEYEADLRDTPRDPDLLQDAAEFYLEWADDGPDRTGWLERAARLAATGAEITKADDPERCSELVQVEARALTELGRAADALSRLDEALRRGADPWLMTERGIVLFELCRFEEARDQLLAAHRADPKDADACHTLGLIEERRRRRDEAERWFRRARSLAPDDFPKPVQLSPAEFDAAVEAALGELPDEIRRPLANVAVAVEDLPGDDDLLGSDPPLSPSILGIFRGTPVGELASQDPWSHFPSSIVLYQQNLQRFARDRNELVEEIRTTVLHEVGHFVGFDEDDLRERDLD